MAHPRTAPPPTVPIQSQVPVPLAEHVRRLAVAEGVAVSAMVRQLLAHACRSYRTAYGPGTLDVGPVDRRS